MDVLTVLNWEHVVFAAGALHFVQPIAMRFVPKVLSWNEDMAKLRPINRQIFRVVVRGLVVTLSGIGLIAVLFPGQLLQTGAGSALLLLMAVQWAYRLWVQLCVYRHTWPKSHRASFVGLSLLLALKAGLYALCFVAAVSVH